ncbi:MAG: Xaa-Pro peptidase family protein [Armatimonadota bacterium]|nr:Xaa-Pro peptidase family protein [Armatimonadota bacterium]MDR7534787.1 Xaa-Pro peptidase family protein [Armatimonadota bacterium]
MRLFISGEEHLRRRAAVRDELHRRQLEALVLFSPAQIFYLTGFAFIATERPIALVVAPDAVVLFTPRLEEEHATAHAVVDRVAAYPEYPGDCHPLSRLGALLEELGLARARLGADSDGYPGVMGYRGPRLSEVSPQAAVTPARDLVEEMMMIKSAEEIALIRESARWGNLAHRLLQDYTRPGALESEVGLRASGEATAAMVRTLGPAYRPLSWAVPGAHAGFRGQVGAQSAIPHAMTTHAPIRAGDVLVTGAAAVVGGYTSELERTMIVGEPTPEQTRYFRLMLGAQETAFAAVRPGRPCAEVDRAVRDFFERHHLMAYWRHHVGHGLGIGIHEAPFLDIGDQTVIRPGMVLSVEPGLYVPGVAGFRHSDTVLVTEDGIDLLTYYPRDLTSLVVPA